ncbi:MAG: DUF6084 family protein [Terriglobales bacterium]
MPELRFFLEGLEPVMHALTPTLRMKLRAVNGTPETIHAIWLRCQIQIEPARRRYSPAEADALLPLFGAPERWEETLRPFLWQQTCAMLPGFTGTGVSDVLLACSQDFTLAATQYCEALGEGEIPLVAQFSGMAMLQGTGGLEVSPIPWELEARYAMPARLWREAVQAMYGNSRWLRLERNACQRLLTFHAASGAGTLEATLDALLEGTAARATKAKREVA